MVTKDCEIIGLHDSSKMILCIILFVCLFVCLFVFEASEKHDSWLMMPVTYHPLPNNTYLANIVVINSIQNLILWLEELYHRCYTTDEVNLSW